MSDRVMAPRPYEKPYGTIPSMTRRQVLVQLHEETVEELDRWAAEMSVSRSELIRRAIQGYLLDMSREEMDRRTIEGYTKVPQDEAEAEAWAKVSLETWPER